MAAAKVHRAKQSFGATIGNVEHFVHEGEVLPARHPVVKAHPELFFVESPVEQATAAPGEKRKR